MDRDELLREVLAAAGRSWRGYRKVRKRVARGVVHHMREVGEDRPGPYLARVLSGPEGRREFNRRTAVTISRFFRDPDLWFFLEKTLLPELARRDEGVLRFWSLGCGCGEEPYTLSIVLHELWSGSGTPVGWEILATDVLPSCLERARRGVYAPSSLRLIAPRRLAGHFSPTGAGTFRIGEAHRRGVVLREHDFLEDPFPQGFHAITARNNMFTYFSPALAAELARRVHRALLPGGYLLTGSHETLPGEVGELFPDRPHRMVWRKTG